MEILEAFVINNNEYKINILWKDDEALFKANDIADVLEIQNIRSSIINFDEDEKVLCNSITTGGNQDTIFLTENGVYRLLMQSRKPIAKPFQKWLCSVIKSIRKTGKYELELKIQGIEDKFKLELEDKFKLALEKEADKMRKTVELNKHTSLVEAFKNKYIVYISKIKNIDDKILIKIGSSFKELVFELRTYKKI
jgi:prophage antirepressor-like protein